MLDLDDGPRQNGFALSSGEFRNTQVDFLQVHVQVFWRKGVDPFVDFTVAQFLAVWKH